MNALMNAMNVDQEVAPNVKKDYFLECEIDHREVVFTQVDGKWRLVDYDKSNPEHKNSDVEITFRFYGTTRDGAPYTIERKMQARSRKRPEWQKVVMPSLKALGVSDPTSQVHRKWVHIEMVKTGEYTNSSGELKDLTTPKFLEIFESQEACEKAAAAFWNERRNGDGSGHDVQTKNIPQPIEENEHPQRAILLAMLPAMWQAAQQTDNADAAFTKMLQSNPMMAEAGITMHSQEVIDLTGIVAY